ncbi:unnamed protein product, partial [Symbiodinium pilosum]
MNFFPKYLGPGDAWSVPVAAAVIFPLICFVLPLKSEKPLLNLKKVALVAASGPDVEATPADMTQGASAISGSSSSFEMVDMGMASLELCFKATEELLRSHCGNMVEVGSVAISAEWQGGVVLHASCSADLLARLVELEWAAALDLKPSINEIVEELWALQEAAPSEPDSEVLTPDVVAVARLCDVPAQKEQLDLAKLGLDTSTIDWSTALDAPEGHVLLVQPAKDDASNICLKCFYVKRGSFNKLKIMDLLAVLFLVPTLQDKFANLRRNHVRVICANPKARPRHESIDVKMYTEKKTSKYVDFQQEGDWLSVDEYFFQKAPADAKKKYKTSAAKKNWKKVLVGTRMSVDKLKRDEHESGQQMEAAFQRDGLKIEMDTNTK